MCFINSQFTELCLHRSLTEHCCRLACCITMHKLTHQAQLHFQHMTLRVLPYHGGQYVGPCMFSVCLHIGSLCLLLRPKSQTLLWDLINILVTVFHSEPRLPDPFCLFPPLVLEENVNSGLSTEYMMEFCLKNLTTASGLVLFFLPPLSYFWQNQCCYLSASCPTRVPYTFVVKGSKVFMLFCWLGGRKGIRPVNNWVVGCWCGYLSGARYRLAYGPADATATHCLLLQ